MEKSDDIESGMSPEAAAALTDAFASNFPKEVESKEEIEIPFEKAWKNMWIAALYYLVMQLNDELEEQKNLLGGTKFGGQVIGIRRKAGLDEDSSPIVKIAFPSPCYKRAEQSLSVDREVFLDNPNGEVKGLLKCKVTKIQPNNEDGEMRVTFETVGKGDSGREQRYLKGIIPHKSFLEVRLRDRTRKLSESIFDWLYYVFHAYVKDQNTHFRSEKFGAFIKAYNLKFFMDRLSKILQIGERDIFKGLEDKFDSDGRYIDSVGVAPDFIRGAFCQDGKEIKQSERVARKLDGAQQTVYGAMLNLDTRVLFVHGGSGTGKTTVLANAVSALHLDGNTTLLTGAANQSLDNSIGSIQAEGVVKDRIWRLGMNEQVVASGQRNIRLRKVFEKYLSEVFDPEDEDRHLDDFLNKYLLDTRGSLLASTFGSLGEEMLEGTKIVDVGVVDEASRMGPWEDWVKVWKYNPRRWFQIGDPFQLSNPDLEPEVKEKLQEMLAWGFYQTVFDKCTPVQQKEIELMIKGVEKGPFSFGVLYYSDKIPYVFLDQDYRHKRKLCDWLSRTTYQGRLKCARKFKPGEDEDGEIIIRDTRNLDAEETTVGTSKVVAVEAHIVCQRVLELLRKGEIKAPADIGAIFAYASQAKKVDRSLRRRLTTKGKKDGELELKSAYTKLLQPNTFTIDKIQGGQRKRGICNLGRSRGVGYLGKPEERVGVMQGRAQDEVEVVMNSKTFIENNPVPESREYFRRFIELAEELGEVVVLERPEGGWPSRRKRNATIAKNERKRKQRQRKRCETRAAKVA